MDNQRTIKKEVILSGIGLHTGNKVNIRFKPAQDYSGLNFVRVDLKDKPVIKATLDTLLPITKSPRRTSICKNGVEIHTIEHLMAVLSGLKIDNLYIEVDNNEVPGINGSGEAFYDVLTGAGIKEQAHPRQYYLIKEPLSIEEDGSTLAVFPASELKISYTLNYDHPLLKSQFLELTITEESFKKELVSARTFCLEEEAQDLIKAGLGKGANYENTLVVGKDGVIKNKLRFEDEFVRHKILDLIGDLYLLGMSIKGHFIAIRSGHVANIKLLDKIIRQKERYSLGGVKADYQTAKEGELDVDEIKKILPHREPFLFVDKILTLEKGKRAVGIKNLSSQDYFFKGHFPGRPIMPGVLIIEAMAQVGGVMMLSPKENRGKLAYFLACDNVKFRKTVLPGDELLLEVSASKLKTKTGLVKAKAFVNGKLVAEADLMFALVES